MVESNLYSQGSQDYSVLQNWRTTSDIDGSTINYYQARHQIQSQNKQRGSLLSDSNCETIG